MKKIYLFLFLLSQTLLANAQVNLVPNPSFEEYDSCPNTISHLSFAHNWLNPTDYTPDYYNSCDIGPFASVPNNTFGFQTARTGNAYAGIITMIETNAREYLQTQLTDSLIANHVYFVNWFVANADTSMYSSSTVGMLFSNNQVFGSSILNLPFIPQVENNVLLNPLNARNAWIEVSGYYTAQGGEKFITIGNFHDDLTTDTIHFNDGTWNASYHYIDDVSITESVGNVNIREIDTETVIFPNPVTKECTISWATSICPPMTISIFNLLGQKIIVLPKNEIVNNTSMLINLEFLSDGLYFLNFQTEKSNLLSKIILISK